VECSAQIKAERLQRFFGYGGVRCVPTIECLLGSSKRFGIVDGKMTPSAARAQGERLLYSDPHIVMRTLWGCVG